MPKPLTPKQRKFISEYLIDRNATQAAIRAGYSKKTADVQGPRLLGKVRKTKFFQNKIKKQEERTEITADRILKELWRLGTVDIRQAFKPDGTLKDIKDIPEDVARAIGGIEVDEIYTGGTKKLSRGHTKKIKFWKKTEALELLGKHLKLFIERFDITGSIKLEDLVSKSQDDKH